MKRYTEDNMPPEKTIIIAVNDIRGTPVKKGDGVINLFEIKNMEKHIAFVDVNDKIWWGYHPDNIREAKDDDL